MAPYTYCMQIIQNEEKENAVMTLDSAIEKIQASQPFTLLEGCPISVSIPEKEQFYVKPFGNVRICIYSFLLVFVATQGVQGF